MCLVKHYRCGELFENVALGNVSNCGKQRACVCIRVKNCTQKTVLPSDGTSRTRNVLISLQHIIIYYSIKL